MVNPLQALVEAWEGGQSRFDRGALAKAFSVDPPAVIEPQFRLALYKWVLLGGARRDAPESFAEFIGTLPKPSDATLAQLEADVAAVVSCVEKVTAAAGGDSPGVTSFDDLKLEIRGLIEFMCVKTGVKYETSSSWQVVPLVLAAIDGAKHGPFDPKSRGGLQPVFSVWYAMRQSHIPSPVHLKCYAEVLDLLLGHALQYHDPLLALHLAQHLCRASTLLLSDWFPSLYGSLAASPEDTAGVLLVWDALLLQRGGAGDDSLIVMVGLALLMLHREALLAAKSKSEVQSTLASLRLPPSVEELEALLHQAQLMASKTPFSTRAALRSYLLAPIDAATVSGVAEQVTRLQQFVALPVDADELTDGLSCTTSTDTNPRPPHLNFVVVDCRAEKSFHHARLPTALHIGNNIGFDPTLLKQMVERFESARGSHLCILGTGRDVVEETSLLQVITLAFVQRGFRHVSFADGGFKACVPRIKAGRAEVVRTPAKQRAPSTASEGAGASPSPAAPMAAPAANSTSKPTSASPAPSDAAAPAPILAKATDGLAAAKSWGMGLMGRWGKKGSSADPDPSRISATTPSASAATAMAPLAGSNASPSTMSGRPSAGSPAPAPPSNQGAQPTSTSLFAPQGVAADDDDDDDFGLVTSVPARPPQAVEPPAADEAAASSTMPEAKEATPSVVEATTGPKPVEATPLEASTSSEDRNRQDHVEQPIVKATASQPPSVQEEPPSDPPAPASSAGLPMTTTPAKDNAEAEGDEDEEFGLVSSVVPTALAKPKEDPPPLPENPTTAGDDDAHPFDDIFN